MKPNLIKIELLLKSRKAILVNNKLIKRTLGFEDMREFCEAIHNWGYSRDFTYSIVPDNWDRYLRTFLRERFLE